MSERILKTPATRRIPAVPGVDNPETPELPADARNSADKAWQSAHDVLEAALEEGSQSINHTQDPTQLKLLDQLLDTLSDELTALNQEDMRSRTISLKAASHQLGEGIDALKDLRKKIAAITSGVDNVAQVVIAIDSVLSGLSSFLATFP